MSSLGDCEICQTANADLTAVRRRSDEQGSHIEYLDMCSGCAEGMRDEGFVPLDEDVASGFLTDPDEE
jgi:hypothetical protein